MSSKLTDLQRTSRVVSILLKLLYLALIVLFVVDVICLVWLAACPGKESVTIGGMNVLSPLTEIYRADAGWRLVLGNLLDCVIFQAIFFLAHRMFKQIYLGAQPLCARYVGWIKTIAALLLVRSVAVPLLVGMVPGEGRGPTVSFAGISMAIVFYALALIFASGVPAEKSE